MYWLRRALTKVEEFITFLGDFLDNGRLVISSSPLARNQLYYIREVLGIQSYLRQPDSTVSHQSMPDDTIAPCQVQGFEDASVAFVTDWLDQDEEQTLERIAQALSRSKFYHIQGEETESLLKLFEKFQGHSVIIFGEKAWSQFAQAMGWTQSFEQAFNAGIFSWGTQLGLVTFSLEQMTKRPDKNSYKQKAWTQFKEFISLWKKRRQ